MPSKITSLEHIRKAREAIARRASQTPESRTEKLEVDVDRLIDVVMDLEERLFLLEKRTRRQQRNLMKLVSSILKESLPSES